MVYAPGTLETDPKKQNISLQQNAAANKANTADIATNTASIATNAADIATNAASIAAMQASWTAFTPTFSPAAGSFTTASAAGRYKQIGKTVFFSMTGIITTNGTGASWLRLSPPVAPLSTENYSFNAYNVTDNILLIGRFLASGSNFDLFKIDGSYPGASGKTYIVSGQYETA